jgi:hypothetical protein
MLTISLLLIMTIPMTSASPAPAIRCELTAETPQSTAGPVQIRFALINEGEDDVHVLVWGTPFEGWLGKVFTVEKDGEPLRYQGRMVKRFAPQEEDYLLLPASRRLSETVDLSQVYQLEADTYRVTFQGTLHDVVAKGQPVPSSSDGQRSMRVECPVLELHLE